MALGKCRLGLFPARILISLAGGSAQNYISRAKHNKSIEFFHNLVDDTGSATPIVCMAMLVRNSDFPTPAANAKSRCCSRSCVFFIITKYRPPCRRSLDAYVPHTICAEHLASHSITDTSQCHLDPIKYSGPDV